MNKVTFVTQYPSLTTVQHGEWNLRLEKAAGMVYVLQDKAFVGRFKYAKPMASAKHFVKFLVANFTPTEYLTALEGKDANGYMNSPLGLLKAKGYISLNELEAQRLTAEQRRRQFPTMLGN